MGRKNLNPDRKKYKDMSGGELFFYTGTDNPEKREKRTAALDRISEEGGIANALRKAYEKDKGDFGERDYVEVSKTGSAESSTIQEIARKLKEGIELTDEEIEIAYRNKEALDLR